MRTCIANDKDPRGSGVFGLEPWTITKTKNKSHLTGGNVCTVDVRIAAPDK